MTFFILSLTLTLPGPSAGVSGSLDSYCSLKPLCSGMGEVVPARTSPTLLPPSPRTVLSLSCFKVSAVHQLSWPLSWWCLITHHKEWTLLQRKLSPFWSLCRNVNSYSASHDNWCTATLWNRIMTVQCEGMGEVGSARYEPALLPPCLSIRALSYSNCQRSTHSNIRAWQCKC